MKLMNKLSAALLGGIALLSITPNEAQADEFFDPFGFNPPGFGNWWSPPPIWPPFFDVLLPDLVITKVIKLNDTVALVKVENIGQAIADPSSVRASNGLGDGLGHVGAIRPGEHDYCLVFMDQGASLSNCSSITSFEADCFKVIAELDEWNNSAMMFCD